jgi:hypothetical protein
MVYEATAMLLFDTSALQSRGNIPVTDFADAKKGPRRGSSFSPSFLLRILYNLAAV